MVPLRLLQSDTSSSTFTPRAAARSAPPPARGSSCRPGAARYVSNCTRTERFAPSMSFTSWGRSHWPRRAASPGLSTGRTRTSPPSTCAGNGPPTVVVAIAGLPPPASAQSSSKTSASERTTSGTRMRSPSSWMCSSERQSKFWLPRYASRPSTTKYFACSTPPMDFAVSSRRTSMPGRFASRSSVSGYVL